MATGCEEVSARLMELLYEELSGDERARLEAHLGGCASCQAELSAFQATRAAARHAFDADRPPARVHEAILRAAAAAAANRQLPIAARPLPARPSFWERFRGRWTLPTFATVGAVAVVVLASKVFLEPEKTVEVGRQAVDLHSGAPTAASAPSPAAALAEPPAEAQPVPLRTAHAPEKKVAPGGGFEPAAAEPRHESASVDGLAGVGAKAKGKGAGPSRLAKGGHDDAEEGGAGLRRPTAEALVATPAPKPAKREKREFAPPPPPREVPAAAAVANDVPMLEEEERAVAASPRGSGGPVAGGAAAPAPTARASVTAQKGPSPTGSGEVNRAAADAKAAPAPAAPTAEKEKDRDTSADDKPGQESAAARADKLFAEGRWAEAARAYRDLLRRDPHNADAARWRQRLAVAEEAAAAPPPAAASPPPR